MMRDWNTSTFFVYYSIDRIIIYSAIAHQNILSTWIYLLNNVSRGVFVERASE